MTEKAQELSHWCRYARVDDTRDDGICCCCCCFELRFKVKDADMKNVFASLCYDDLCDVAYTILDVVCSGCEEFDEDWRDPDCEKFVLNVRMSGDFIVMKGNYRT